MVSRVEVAVIGGGPAGLVAGALLAVSGVPAVLVAPPAPPDTRTTALMQSALSILQQIGIWPALAPKTGALRKLRLIDDSGSLIRAPEILFDSDELGLTAFGRNIANTDLLAALDDAIRNQPDLDVRTSRVGKIDTGQEATHISLETGEEFSARLVIGADGRNSVCREAASIRARIRDYPQAALTLNISHTRPHDGISTEFHRRAGPMVVVPLPGDRSSVVLVETPDDAARLAALDDAALGLELERRTHGLFGRIVPDSSRGTRPLGGLSVDRFGANRIALIGEAAHVLPPIGAQGLNLGIRDAAGIADLAKKAITRGQDPGAPEILQTYDRDRRADAAPRQTAVDLLNRSLLANVLPLDMARALGLWALSAIPPLRREVMRRGVALPHDL